MTGIYIKCEKCAATLGGEQVTPRQQGMRPLRRGDDDKLRAAAAALGWSATGKWPQEVQDFCPAHALEQEVAP